MTAKKINLLPAQEFEESNLGRVLKWLLSTFRVFVIVLEGIVITAFLSRFWLDAKNADLNQTIKQKQAVIESNTDFEKQFVKTQKKLKIFSSLNENDESMKIISLIASHLPTDVKLSNITLEKGTVNLKGESSNEASIDQFIVNLGADPEFKDTSLSQVSTDPQDPSLLSFTVAIKRKG